MDVHESTCCTDIVYTDVDPAALLSKDELEALGGVKFGGFLRTQYARTRLRRFAGYMHVVNRTCHLVVRRRRNCSSFDGVLCLECAIAAVRT